MSTEKFVLRGKKMVIDKDPQAVLDYSVDLTQWLNGDTIASFTVTTTGGLTEDSLRRTNTSTKMTAWIADGDLFVPGGAYASATFHFTTNGVGDPPTGIRVDDRTLYFKVVQK